MKTCIWSLAAVFCLSCAAIGTPSPAGQDAPTDDTVDYFHGEKVADPYRWLEIAEANETEEWIAKQNQQAEAYFAKNKLRQKLLDRLIEIEKTSRGSFDQLKWSGGKLFALHTVPPKHQPVLVTMPSYAEVAVAKTILDPNLLTQDGSLAIDWYVPSHDGRYVAVSMSQNGTEAGDLYIYDLAPEPKRKRKGKRKKRHSPANDVGDQNGASPFKPIEDIISNVNRASLGGDLVWDVENKGFFYTRYPDSTDLEGIGSLSQRLFYHKLGKASGSDKMELGDDFERTEQIELEVDSRSGRIIATVRQGVGGPFSHYLRNPNGEWIQVSKYGDGIEEIVFAPKGGMFLLSRARAPRGRLEYLSSPKMPLEQAKRVIPESNENVVGGIHGVRSVLVTATRIYMVYQLGGPSEIRVFDHNGNKLDTINIEDAAVGPDLVSLDGDEILLRVEGYIAPLAWYRYDGILGDNSLMKTGISTTYGIGYGNAVVDTETVISKDGAKVPLFVVRQSTTPKDGNRPTLLFGAGGFGRAFTPTYASSLAIWLEKGGIAAFAGVRGGGEFGEGWHLAGSLVYKQNSISDFVAAAGYLVKNQYTSSKKIALCGTGHGGLIAGAAIVQHPDMAGALVIDRGLFDMLRHQFSPLGEVTLGEYGSVNDENQFKALRGYSPYHNISERESFPAMLIVSGSRDYKVSPWHSRKFAAQVQRANSSLNPIIYEENPTGGTGRNTPFMQKLEENAEKLAFLFKELGISL